MPLVEHFWTLVLASRVNGCVFISTFISVVGAPTGVVSSAVGINILCKTTLIYKAEVNN